MADRRDDGRRIVGTGTLETRVFEKGWGAVHPDANSLVLSNRNYEFADAASATRAATLAAVSKLDDVACFAEHPFAITALSHAKSDPWPSAVLNSLTTSPFGSDSSSVDSSVAQTIRAVLDTLKVQGTASKLEKTGGRLAPSVLAALQPREAVWVSEAMWSPPDSRSDVAGEVECEFEDKRQFGADGLAANADVPKPEVVRKRAKQPSAPSSTLRPSSHYRPLRSSSNAVDSSIGNKYSNRRLASGPGKSTQLVELGTSRSKGRRGNSEFSLRDREKNSSAPQTVAEKKWSAAKDRAASNGKSQRMARVGSADPSESASLDADTGAGAAEKLRMENPKYRRTKQAEARARKHEEEKEAKELKKLDKDKKPGGKRGRHKRLSLKERIESKYGVPSDSAEPDSDSHERTGRSEEQQSGKDGTDGASNVEAISEETGDNDEVQIIDLEEDSGGKRRRLESERYNDANESMAEMREGMRPDGRAPAEAAAVFQAVADYRNAGIDRGLAGRSKIPGAGRPNNLDFSDPIRTGNWDIAATEAFLEAHGSDPTGIFHSNTALVKEVQAFMNGYEGMLVGQPKGWKDYKLCEVWCGVNQQFFDVALRIYAESIVRPGEARFLVINFKNT